MISKKNTSPSHTEMMQHCHDWLSSGVNQKTFCKQRGLNYSRFVSCRMQIIKQEKLRKFTPVEVCQEPRSAKKSLGLVVKVTLPNSIVLECCNDIDIQALKDLITAIGSLPC